MSEKTKGYPTAKEVNNFQTKLKTRRLVDIDPNIRIAFSHSDKYSLDFGIHYIQLNCDQRRYEGRFVGITPKSDDKKKLMEITEISEYSGWFTKKPYHCVMSHCKATQSELEEIDKFLEEDGILQMISS